MSKPCAWPFAGLEQSPTDAAQKNSLLRRVHALASAARVLGFASVAEALTEAERKLRRAEFGDVARALDLLPSLVLGVPMALRPATETHADRAPSTWPLSVLIFGAQSLADAIKAIPGTHVECERTEDLSRAREQARLFGPDLAVIDADRAGARDLVETFARDSAGRAGAAGRDRGFREPGGCVVVHCARGGAGCSRSR